MKRAIQAAAVAILLLAAAACATSKQSEKDAPAPEKLSDNEVVVVSQIEGDFTGWSGNTVFEFTNGDRWKQSRYSYLYTVDRNPHVTIYKTDRGHVMKVEGVSETVYVRKLGVR